MAAPTAGAIARPGGAGSALEQQMSLLQNCHSFITAQNIINPMSKRGSKSCQEQLLRDPKFFAISF